MVKLKKKMCCHGVSSFHPVENIFTLFRRMCTFYNMQFNVLISSEFPNQRFLVQSSVSNPFH